VADDLVTRATSSVLLIDDDHEALAIFEQILREHGFDVHTAATAESGLLQLEASVPASIVLDLRLPALDGLECLQRIRAMPSHADTPVTIVTGDYLVDEGIVAQIEAMGARLCFKPLWQDDLLRIVRQDTCERR
jgi:DNA-binding response OmpR family regulator